MINAQHAHIYRIHTLHFIFGEIFFLIILSIQPLLKLFMRIPHKFIDPNRVDGELATALNDRDTIVSAQRETANMIYRQYGNDGNIWSPPQVVALPVERKEFHSHRSRCETLFSQLNAQSEVNGGAVPNNAVHQMFLYLRFILVSS
jgi:hypothetical protein